MVGGSLRVLRLLPPLKLVAEILLNVELKPLKSIIKIMIFFFLGAKDTILHPVSESSVDGFVKDEQPRHYTHVSEGSSSGS